MTLSLAGMVAGSGSAVIGSEVRYVPVGLPPVCECGEPWTRPRMETLRTRKPAIWRVTWTCARGWHSQVVTLEEKE